MDFASPLAGTTLGRYRIDALIGTGGMGAVYRAYDTVLKRPLAIKVLRDSSSDNQLLREAQSASALITRASAPSTKSAASAAPPSSRWSTWTASRWR